MKCAYKNCKRVAIKKGIVFSRNKIQFVEIKVCNAHALKPNFFETKGASNAI